jgi:hypothetical protein
VRRLVGPTGADSEVERRAGGGRARAARAVGGRQLGPPALVVCRRRRPPGREPAADPAVRQLQHGGRLVSGVVADHHRELGGDSDDTWTVPVGGGFGKIFRIGNQPMNAQLQGFYNVEHPQFGPEWIMRFQLQFLFPR